MNKELKVVGKVLLQSKYRKSLAYGNENPIQVIRDGNKDSDNYVVIRRRNKEVGTFSDYIVFLGYIEKAIDKNKKPIIDRKTIKCNAVPADDNVNTWELFFEQPYNIGLDDIKDNDNLTYWYTAHETSVYVTILHCIDETVIEYHRQMAKKYLRFNISTKKYVEDYYNKLLKGKRVLGINVREGYQVAANSHYKGINNHPIQASADYMLELAEKYMKEWQCGYVYFSCQTGETEQAFKSKFKDKAICLDRNRPFSSNDAYDGSMVKKSNDAIEEERKYVTEMYLLSKCNSYICTENSGAEAAYIMSDGYEHFMCLDLGKYKDVK